MVLNNKRLIAILFTGLAALSVVILPPISQPLAYHHFADSRRIWGIANFFNVVTNLPFLIIGLIGLHYVLERHVRLGIRISYTILFTGVFLTALGSAYYHYDPNNDTLVWDRLPLTIVFMSLLSATIAEIWNPRLGTVLLFPLVILGIASVWWWHFTESRGLGDLRPYLFVQFYPVFFIPLLLWLFYSPDQNSKIRILVWVVVWYIIAKIFEQFDELIYRYFPISGHSLKHLAAAISTWYFVLLFRGNYRTKPPRSNVRGSESI